MRLLAQIRAEFVKKLTLWRRRPIWVLIGVVAPLGLSTFFIACFAAMVELPVWEIGLVDEDRSVQSEALMEAILSHEGTMPYYEVATDNLDEAMNDFEAGRLFMVVRIPEGFGRELAAGSPVAVEAWISNAHADQTKNLRLGLDARLYLFYESYMLPASERPGVVYAYSTSYPVEIPRSGYMASGALMLTIILASMMYAGLFSALEHQEKTALEVKMSPGGSLAGMAGTVMATVVEVFILLAIVGAVNAVLWHLQLPPASSLPHLLLAVVLLATTFSLLGYALGNKAGDVRLVLGPTMITVLALWLFSGGVNPIEAMAVPQFLQWLPTTAALRVLAKDLVGLETLSVGTNLAILGAWAAAAVALALAPKVVRDRARRS